MGDAVITPSVLHLVVDGRYTLQASQEVPSSTVTTSLTGIEVGWLGLLKDIASGQKVGIESERVSLSLMRLCGERARADGWSLVPLGRSPLEGSVA